jgi:hypothetical protein
MLRRRSLERPERLFTMWPAIDRARRRLSDRAGAPANATQRKRDGASPALQPDDVPVVEDVVIVLGRSEIALLLVALEAALGNAVDHPDTPATLERALSLLIASRGEPGRPHVLRRPAVLSTPESWEIHLDGIEPATGIAVREAARTGVFA